MFKIQSGVIYLTKGDSADINVEITAADGTAYTMLTGDTLKLTVREYPNKTDTVIMTKSSTTNTISIEPADTSDAEVGQYSADIQLTTAAGAVYTVWPEFDTSKLKSETTSWKNFWITPEVSE